MKFKYFKISEKEKILQEEGVLYLNKTSDFNDFFERITITKNIVLKEEKETMFFFKSLDSNAKKMYNINSYFDCIDIAYDYYSLMSDLYYSHLELNDIKCETWQYPYLKTLFSIHENMLSKVINGYVPRYLKEYESKINTRFLNGIKKVVFVNKMYTTENEKNILKEVEKYVEIEYHIYASKDDFDEDALILKDISFDKLDKNVNILTFKDDFSLVTKLLEILKDKDKEDILISDYSEDKTKYTDICENMLDFKKEVFMNSSKSYKLIKYIYDISLENDMYKIYTASVDPDFNEVFDIKEDITKIKSMAKNGVKRATTFDNLPRLKYIFELSLEELIEKITSVFSNEASDILEAATEILALENFDFTKGIITTNTDMLKLFLKYLDAKKMTRKLEDTKFKISSPILEEVNEYILLNVHEAKKPKVKEYILNTNQRKELGLRVSNDFKYVESYNYIRQIYLSENTTIMYVLNIDKDMDVISIFKNFKYINELSSENIEYTTNDKISMINNSYEMGDIKRSPVFLKDGDRLNISSVDKNNMTLTAYKLYPFLRSPVEYFLNQSITNNREIIEVNENIVNVNVIGNIVHSIFENDSNYDYLTDYSGYIKKEYRAVYDELLFKNVREYKEEFLKDKKIEGIETRLDYEVYSSKGQVLPIRFRIDMIYDKNNMKYITDIKSGKKKLDIDEEYKLQLLGYRELYAKINNIDKESIFVSLTFPIEKNEQKFELDKINNILTLDGIKEQFENLLSKDYVEVVKKDLKDYNLRKNIIRGDDYESKDN